MDYFRKILILIMIAAGLQLQAREKIPALMATLAETPDEKKSEHASRKSLPGILAANDFNAQLIDYPKDRQALRNLAIESEIPLYIDSVLYIQGDELIIESSLYHAVDDVLIQQSQSSGALALGADGKWGFIISAFAGPAHEYPIEYPVKPEENIPISDTNGTIMTSRTETVPETGPETDAIADSPFLHMKSIHIASGIIFPFGRYRDIARIGGNIHLHLSANMRNLPLQAGLQAGSTIEISESQYVDQLMNAYIQLAFSRAFVFGAICLTPVFSYGIISHFVSGEFNTLDNQTSVTYTDQLIGLDMELQYGNVFASPGIHIFPNKNTVGIQASIRTGFSIQL